MIHPREDWNRIQDPALHDPDLTARLEEVGSTPIAQDEPVFCVRAKDKHALSVLEHYYGLVAADSADEGKSLQDHIQLMKQWQSIHGTKTPDIPKTSTE